MTPTLFADRGHLTHKSQNQEKYRRILWIALYDQSVYFVKDLLITLLWF